jgi:hypothetical protein
MIELSRLPFYKSFVYIYFIIEMAHVATRYSSERGIKVIRHLRANNANIIVYDILFNTLFQSI